MAALGGAKGVNLADRTGSLTVGKQADVVLYDLTNISLLPQTDPIQLLVLGKPNEAVDSVWVGGKLIVAEGKVLTVDVSGLEQTLFNRSQGNSKPQFQTIHQVEAHYRDVMNEW